MRGKATAQQTLLMVGSVEERIPKRHPIRRIKTLADEALESMSEVFEEMYARVGRPSVPPERLLKAQLLMALFSVRSDRQFCEQLEYNLLFRWFLDLQLDEPSFDASTFSHNRKRLIEHEAAQHLLAAIVAQARGRNLLSEEHFSVDGTLIEAWASMKSFRPKDEPPSSGDSNGWSDFRGQKRSNDTHASRTDPDAKMFRKGRGHEAKLRYCGNVLMENRSGLLVDVDIALADGYGERDGAARMLRRLPRVATAANEADLLDFARAGTAAHVERLVRAWRRVDRIEEMEHEERRHASRSLTAYTDEDGMVVVRGRLTPEAGAALLRALDAAREKLYDTARGKHDATGEEPSGEQRRADALGLVAESALAGGLDPGTRGDRYQVVVHVDAGALPAESGHGASALEDGQHVSAETARRLACDAAKVVMRHARDGTILDVGRRTRTIPPGLRRALAYRDAGCRFPGCGLKLCDAHHVEHWADGGETKLGNLVQLCRRHHRAVHEEGFTVELLAGGEARFRRPNGWTIEEAPALPRVAGDAVAALARRLDADSVHVDAGDCLPTCDGGPVEIGWAVDWMRGLAAPGGS